MRSVRPNSLRNPFKNQFNDPVTWRLDEMQAHSGVIWPKQRTHGTHETESDTASATSFVTRSDGKADGGKFTGVFALFLVLLVSVVLFRVM